MISTRVTNDDVYATLHNNDLNLDNKSYADFIITAHYRTNRLNAQYPSGLIDEALEEYLKLIELRLAAHYFIDANPIVKEVKGDDHGYKLNVGVPVTGVLGSSFGRAANTLSSGRLLQMETDEAQPITFLFVA